VSCVKLATNGPAVFAVGAASRWHEFLQVYCAIGERISLLIYRGGKNHDTMCGSPESGNGKVYTLMFVPLAGRQLHIPTC